MSSSVKIRGHVQSVIDPDGAVLLDLKKGKYFSLNGIGAEIWTQLEAGRTIPEIESHLVRVYDAPADMLRADLAGFMTFLGQEDLVDARA